MAGKIREVNDQYEEYAPPRCPKTPYHRPLKPFFLAAAALAVTAGTIATAKTTAPRPVQAERAVTAAYVPASTAAAPSGTPGPSPAAALPSETRQSQERTTEAGGGQESSINRVLQPEETLPVSTETEGLPAVTLPELLQTVAETVLPTQQTAGTSAVPTVTETQTQTQETFMGHLHSTSGVKGGGGGGGGGGGTNRRSSEENPDERDTSASEEVTEPEITQPSEEITQPSEEITEPSEEDTDPVVTEPSEEDTDPVVTEPSEEDTDPVVTEPSEEDTDPVVTEPSEEDTDPVVTEPSEDITKTEESSEPDETDPTEPEEEHVEPDMYLSNPEYVPDNNGAYYIITGELYTDGDEVEDVYWTDANGSSGSGSFESDGGSGVWPLRVDYRPGDDAGFAEYVTVYVRYSWTDQNGTRHAGTTSMDVYF